MQRGHPWWPWLAHLWSVCISLVHSKSALTDYMSLSWILILWTALMVQNYFRSRMRYHIICDLVKIGSLASEALLEHVDEPTNGVRQTSARINKHLGAYLNEGMNIQTSKRMKAGDSTQMNNECAVGHQNEERNMQTDTRMKNNCVDGHPN